jgi:hypothetical protein
VGFLIFLFFVAVQFSLVFGFGTSIFPSWCVNWPVMCMYQNKGLMDLVLLSRCGIDFAGYPNSGVKAICC